MSPGAASQPSHTPGLGRQQGSPAGGLSMGALPIWRSLEGVKVAVPTGSP